MPQSIRLLFFPPHDLELEALTWSLMETLVRDGRDDGELAQFVATTVRETYPLCVIRSADPLAEAWPDLSTWYVYRDGSPMAGLGLTAAEAGRGHGQTIGDWRTANGKVIE